MLPFGARPARPGICSVPGVRPGQSRWTQSLGQSLLLGQRWEGFRHHSEHVYPGLAHVSWLLVSVQKNGPVYASRGCADIPSCPFPSWRACTRSLGKCPSFCLLCFCPSGCSHPETWQGSSLSLSPESLHTFAHQSTSFPVPSVLSPAHLQFLSRVRGRLAVPPCAHCL